MATMTSEQAEKINARCSNDWKFDARRYIMHSGEKQLCKQIQLDDTHVIRAEIYFQDTYKNFKRDGLEIVLHVDKLTLCGDFYHGGIGLFRSIPYSKNRRMFSDLEKLTAIIDDEYIMQMYSDNAEKCANNILLDKDGWHLHEV